MNNPHRIHGSFTPPPGSFDPQQAGRLQPQVFQRALEQLGSPHLRLPPIFHIAGTNGKGSTQAFIRSILQQGGWRVHAFTSPHLVRFNERIILDGQEIADATLEKYWDLCANITANQKLSWFQMTTLVAFMAFSEKPADVLLLETGMGGTHDPTNVIQNPVCSIITSISPDHEDILGKFPTGVATEKAGIMKRNRPVVTCNQDPAVQSILEETAQKQNCPLYTEGRDWSIVADHEGLKFTFGSESYICTKPSMPGEHQIRNAGLALAALHTAVDLFPLASPVRNEGIKKADWPGRLQNLATHPISSGVPAHLHLYLDGAHNEGGMGSLAMFLENQKAFKCVILGCMKRKNLSSLLQPLAGHVSLVIGIPVPGEDCHSPAEIAETAKIIGIPSQTAASPQDALMQISHIQNVKEGTIIIAGSLYLAGKILKNYF